MYHASFHISFLVHAIYVGKCGYVLTSAKYITQGTCHVACMHVSTSTASVAEWLRAWDTLTMFEARVCGRSIPDRGNIVG